MTTIDFTYNGGYPFDQPTLNKMQLAYFEILKSFVGFMRIPEVGNHVLFGCEIVAGNITPGMMYIDGDLCSFAQVAGTNATKIKKLSSVVSLPFSNGTNNPVWKTTTAIVDGTGVALSDFTRLSNALVYDAQYVHTDKNFTQALLTKLNGIEALAQKNVKSNWNSVNPLSDSFIENKPAIFQVLRQGSVLLGDIINQDYNVPFAAISTDNYMVIPSFEAITANAANQSATIVHVIHSLTTTGFKLRMAETGNHSQNLKFKYLICPL